jgi:orotidine-5'-phosphate decarboxylase
LREGGWEIFLDIKLHDIPNTVAAAIKALSAENIWAVTLHTSGGSAMMSAAADIRDDKRPLLFGVTVLTSHDSKTWEEVNPGCSMESALLKRAESAMSSHMDGIVCSPRELPMFGQRDFESLLKIVPGVRPVDYVMNDDQKRTATPADAARGGADFVVVGRPITQAADPGEVIDVILEELKQ